MKTIAIVIGVSKYQDSSFQVIPGASLDAERFSSALTLWGVSKESIHLLLDAEATKANVIKTLFNCRSSFDNEAKLIFYFAGHGVRDNLIHHETPESSLALHDTIAEDSLFTGLRLIELMQLIRRLKPVQVFLFIDACRLRLNHIINPLNDGDILSTTTSAGLFCLFSSGTRQSYEDSLLKYGYFTKALLKSISELRHDMSSTCQDIAKKVSQLLFEQDLPIPEVYQIGHEKMWPLEHSLQHLHRPTTKGWNTQNIIFRESAIAKLQDHLVTTPDPLVWLWGENGMGKSVIAEQFNQQNGSAFYVSIPNISASYGAILQMVIEQIRAQRSEIFSNQPHGDGLFETLVFILSYQPGSIFILDELDRLLTPDLEALIIELDRVPIPCLLISRYPCPKELFRNRKANLFEICASSLQFEQIDQLVMNNGFDSSFSKVLLEASKGNILKAREMLVDISGHELPTQGNLTKDYINTMASLVVCGGFIDELLFCQVFKIKAEHLVMLEKLGFIRYTKEGCLPHDQLIEIVEEGNWFLDIEKACQYWNFQIQHTPYNLWACRSLVLMASQLERNDQLKNSLTQCLRTLNERESVHFLLDLVQIFRKEKWEDLLLEVSDSLISHEEYHTAGEILQELSQSEKSSIKRIASLYNAKRLVYLGQPHECIRLYSGLLTKSRLPELIIPLSNTLGISHFFLGELNTSAELFQSVIKQQVGKRDHHLGVADLMTGLIMTYRGESVIKAKELIEKSLQIFECLKDHLWISIGLNALAELTYRLERWHQSFHCLGRALELAQNQKSRIFTYYTIKNMARVYLRLDPNHHELSNIVLKMESYLKETKGLQDSWVMMWVQNTLATVYAYWNEIHKLKIIVEDIVTKTVGFPSCHIYTLSNLGHLATLEKNDELASYYYSQARHLAEQTGNQLALQDVTHDMSRRSSNVSFG